jgi:hypothetical protein
MLPGLAKGKGADMTTHIRDADQIIAAGLLKGGVMLDGKVFQKHHEAVWYLQRQGFTGAEALQYIDSLRAEMEKAQ